MFISYLTIGMRCGKMEKCYNCGEETVYWLGNIEDTERGILEKNYFCENCGVDIVVYKELEDAH